MRKKWIVFPFVVVLLTPAGWIEAKDRTLDLSLNTFYMCNSYGLSSDRHFFWFLSLDFLLNLSRRIGLYIEGSMYKDVGKGEVGVVSLGIESRWDLNHSETKRIQIFGRAGAGIHVYSSLTFQYSFGGGMKLQLGKRIWIRGPEIDVFMAKKGYRSAEVLKPQFRFLLGLLFKIG